jgi:hypothetical protein
MVDTAPFVGTVWLDVSNPEVRVVRIIAVVASAIIVPIFFVVI